MMAAGCHSLYPMERLSVAGLSEVVTRLPEILSIRRQLIKRFRDDPPDAFIGIDAPDFNISLERKLRQSGIPAVHYVSPTVWAWRGYRVKKISRSVDLMLTIFPFEAEIYTRRQVAAQFVGHPLADAIPGKRDKGQARRELGLPATGEIVALLPGSRLNEVQAMAPPLLQTARWLTERRPGLEFVVPLVNTITRNHFEQVREQEGKGVAITVVDNRSRAAMAAADAVAVAAGTATMEALLLQRPSLVVLRVSKLTYHLGKRMASVDSVGMPNLLAGRRLMPEFVQDNLTAEKLGPAILEILENPQAWTATQAEFEKIGTTLRKGADESAAAATLEFLGVKSRSD